MIYWRGLKQFYSAGLSLYRCIPSNSVIPEDFCVVIIKIKGLFGEPLIVSMKGLSQFQWKS